MKTTLVPELMMASLLAGFTAPAVAADLPVSLNIQIGIPPIQIGIPPVVLSVPPSMIWVPSLGAYAAYGSPYPILYIGGYFYYQYRSAWYLGPSYAGPWRPIPKEALPMPLRHFEAQQWGHIQGDFRRSGPNNPHWRFFGHQDIPHGSIDATPRNAVSNQ